MGRVKWNVSPLSYPELKTTTDFFLNRVKNKISRVITKFLGFLEMSLTGGHLWDLLTQSDVEDETLDLVSLVLLSVFM